MKSRTVETLTSNEGAVRLRIFEGDIPLDEAGAELLRIERANNAALRIQIRELQEEIK